MVLDVAGIQTGNQHRDDHLRTGDFLDAAAHPYLTFDATDVKHIGGDSFEGSTVINRKDFGMTYNAVLETGGVMISERVTLEFDLSAVKAAADLPVR